MQHDTILVLGAAGQIGTVLTESLRNHYGNDRVIASDLRLSESSGPSIILDALDGNALQEVVKKYKITQIYHLVAILSARGEQDPRWAWDINMRSFFNVLEVAKSEKVAKVFFPSSIAVFGKNAKRKNTPQDQVLVPETVYGVSKVAGENWCHYFHHKYGLDIRGLRYPGLISYQSPPGGGTTDYAVDIFHQAKAKGAYTCFLKEDTFLPMMYMPDAVRATMELMEAEAANIKIRTAYNLNALSFNPAQLAAAIKTNISDFQIQYEPDFRQSIADSWPQSVDDRAARTDWGWKPEFTLKSMTKDMLAHL